MKFKEGDIIRFIYDKESKPFIIEEIRDDRYFNRKGFYITEDDEVHYELVGNSKEYDNFITCRDNLYSIIQSMESLVNKSKIILSLDPFNKEDVKGLKEMHKLAINKIDLFKGRLENIKGEFKELEK